MQQAIARSGRAVEKHPHNSAIPHGNRRVVRQSAANRGDRRASYGPVFTPTRCHTHRSSPQREKPHRALDSGAQTPHQYVLRVVHRKRRCYHEQLASPIRLGLERLPNLTRPGEPPKATSDVTDTVVLVDETGHRAQLEDLQGNSTTSKRPPETTLEILGQSRVEQRWEELLVYFLDSTNPHGFDTDVLRAFLSALYSHGDTSMFGSLRNLENVEVSSQVSTGNGIFDILLRRPDKWFVCIELKVDSPETSAQTERYAEATRLGDPTRANTAGLTSTSTLLPKRPLPQSRRTSSISPGSI